MSINSIIRRAAEAQARRDSVALPKAHTRRERSLNETLNEYHQPGYYLCFCFHDKSIFEICSACKRTKADAVKNLSSL